MPTGPSVTIPDVHRHREAESSPADAAFLRSFGVTFVLAAVLLARLVWWLDPLATFGTGRWPPVVSADRDYKAALLRQMEPQPEVVILGSSRVKTLDPACVEWITGHRAFNFGVNGGGAEDFLAVYRLARALPAARVRQILLGADPEAFENDRGARRPVAQSRALAPYAPASARSASGRSLGADLLGWESVSAAFRSASRLLFSPNSLPLEALEPNGLQRYPRWEDEIRRGSFPQEAQVVGSIPGIRGRYASFGGFAPDRLAFLDSLLIEARGAGAEVIAFVPPVHPALIRATEGTALPARTDELVRLLHVREERGLLRYVETRSLDSFGGDTTLYFDAIHYMAGNANRLVATLYGQPPGACALQ